MLALACAIVAGGCGGDDESSTSEWADDTCSAATTWTDSISAAAQSLQGGNLSQEAFQSAVDDVKEATETFTDDLEDLEAPETEAGQQAKESIDQLADELQPEVDELESAVEDAEGAGASGILSAVPVISSTLMTMGNEVSSTFSELQQLDVGGELEDAFEQADSCDELRNRG